MARSNTPCRAGVSPDLHAAPVAGDKKGSMCRSRQPRNAVMTATTTDATISGIVQTVRTPKSRPARTARRGLWLWPRAVAEESALIAASQDD